MRPYVVLKFGGTSVATRARWDTIGQIARARLEEGLRPVIICSAISGISNALEGLIRKIVQGAAFDQDLKSIEAIHFELARELGVDAEAILVPELRKLEKIVLGASLVQEVTPRIHAHIMAFGEILATRIGAAYLCRQNLEVSWQDARDCLFSRPEEHVHEQRSYLSAVCPFDEDAGLRERFATLGDVILTQGFIARNQNGQTVLLGRGGSDTSASYFAAKLGALRCEIWTDVPGLYTANPRQIPTARILSRLDYDEAQEMASMGAKVLHPRCIAPVKAARIPLHIRCTSAPELLGTMIADSAATGVTRVKCISTKTNVSLISVESLGMWQEVGFLADLFVVFKTHGLSIDLVSTSETNVTVSIDPLNNALLPSALEALVQDLSRIGKVKHLSPCAAVSLVGRNIRSILHQLGPALRVFEEQKVFLVSQAASDLNLTFVVQEDEAARLVQELHHLLFDRVGADPAFGASWQDTFERKTAAATVNPIWWQDRASTLLELAAKQSPLYVYDAATLRSSAQALKSLRAVDQVFYAMKANNNTDVLKTFYQLGLGFECVSVGELECIFGLFGSIDPARVLFTPNFASRTEYVEAFRRKCHVTLDNLFPLEQWPELFAGKKIFLRLDPGEGLGHHKHVRTAGEQSKFGISQNQIAHAASLIERCNATVVGLHAHAGSGITKPSHWVEMADFLMSAAQSFPLAKVLNLGGGLFVPSNIHDDAIDLAQFDEALLRLKDAQPQFQFWLEPGRFLVANAGVLLTRVTQLKEKGDTCFVGVDTGMNSLIRPALYGAHHHIVNLTRANDPVDVTAHIVGPICESGDTLGYDRKLPKTFEGDVLLVATAGAYGRVMSSLYNLREPANEYFLSE